MLKYILLLSVFIEYGVFLAELTVDLSYSLAIRQLASVLLKQYVEVHWSQHSDKYRPPETTEAVISILWPSKFDVTTVNQQGVDSELYYLLDFTVIYSLVVLW